MIEVHKKIYSYLKKDTLLLINRKKYLYLSILVPLIISLIFLLLLSPGKNEIKMGVCNLDLNSPTEILSKMQGFSPIFYEKENCENKLIEDIKSNKIPFGILIPEGFSENLQNTKQSKIILYYDNTDIALSNLLAWKIDQSTQPFEREIIDSLNKELKDNVKVARSNVNFVKDIIPNTGALNSKINEVDQSLIKLESLETEFILNPIWTDKREIYETKKLKEIGITFVLPIISLFVLLLLSSTSIIYDKKTNFLLRVKTSTSPIVYLISKIIFFYFFMLAQTLIIFIIFLIYGARFTLTLDLVPNILYLVLILAIINSLLGIIIGLISDNEGIAILFSLIISLPLMLLSGIFYPIQTLPTAIQFLVSKLPLQYEIDITKAILLFNSEVNLNWIYPALILLVISAYLINKKE